MNTERGKSGTKEYSKALDLIFDNNLTDDVAISFESGGYILCLDIRNGKAEIIFYKL